MAQLPHCLGAQMDSTSIRSSLRKDTFPLTLVSSRYLASASPFDSSVIIWDRVLGVGTPLARWGGPGIHLIKWSPNGYYLFAATTYMNKHWASRIHQGILAKPLLQVISVFCIRNQDLELSKMELLETLPSKFFHSPWPFFHTITNSFQLIRPQHGVQMDDIWYYPRQARAQSMLFASEKNRL